MNAKVSRGAGDVGPVESLHWEAGCSGRSGQKKELNMITETEFEAIVPTDQTECWENSKRSWSVVTNISCQDCLLLIQSSPYLKGER